MLKTVAYCYRLQRNLSFEAYRQFFELRIEVDFWCRRRKQMREGERNCDESDKGFEEEGFGEDEGERERGSGGF